MYWCAIVVGVWKIATHPLLTILLMPMLTMQIMEPMMWTPSAMHGSHWALCTISNSHPNYGKNASFTLPVVCSNLTRVFGVCYPENGPLPSMTSPATSNSSRINPNKLVWPSNVLNQMNPLNSLESSKPNFKVKWQQTARRSNPKHVNWYKKLK